MINGTKKKKHPTTTEIRASTANKKWRKVAASSSKSGDEVWDRLIKIGRN